MSESDISLLCKRGITATKEICQLLDEIYDAKYQAKKSLLKRRADIHVKKVLANSLLKISDDLQREAEGYWYGNKVLPVEMGGKLWDKGNEYEDLYHQLCNDIDKEEQVLKYKIDDKIETLITRLEEITTQYVKELLP